MVGATEASVTLSYPVPAKLDDPRFRWLFEYWCERVKGAALPGRGDLDPVDFPRLLGQLNLIDVLAEDGKPRFRYRLCGSLVTGILGQDYTTCFLDEIEDSEGCLESPQVLRQVVRAGRPHFWQRPAPKDSARFDSYRRLLLPLADDGECIDMLLALVIGDPAPHRRAANRRNQEARERGAPRAAAKKGRSASSRRAER